MPTFVAPDGTELAYHLRGEGRPLVCLPGGPMRAASYLGDLGGLSASRQLIMLDLRGTGQSAAPADPASYRCDRQIEDVSALQSQLDLDNVDMLAHSAGANIAVQYAIRHPRRVSKLALITPSGRAVDLDADGDMRREIMRLRAREPWYPDAAAAFERIQSGTAAEADWDALTPFVYGRWDAAAKAHAAGERAEMNEDAASAFIAEGAFDPIGARAALASLNCPVLVLAGGADLSRPPRILTRYAELFPAAKLVIQPDAGHYPWIDDAELFTSTVTAFLDGML
jgi:proline iminopeptidase